MDWKKSLGLEYVSWKDFPLRDKIFPSDKIFTSLKMI